MLTHIIATFLHFFVVGSHVVFVFLYLVDGILLYFACCFM